MSEQVSSLCRSCFFQLRQIRTIRWSWTSDSTKTLVNAFVNSRLDYCNSLLYGVGEGLMDRLQRVQNAAARLVSGAKKYDHITPIMMDLHWLPIRRRVTFKVATLVYKCLHGCASVYLADDCVAVSFVDSWSSVFALGGASGVDGTADENNDFRSACLFCVWTNGQELVAMHTEIARTVL